MGIATAFDKSLVFLVALAIVAVFTVLLNEWSSQFNSVFLRTGRLELIIYLLAFTFGLGYVLRYLLKLEIRLLTDSRRPQIPRERRR